MFPWGSLKIRFQARCVRSILSFEKKMQVKFFNCKYITNKMIKNIKHVFLMLNALSFQQKPILSVQKFVQQHYKTIITITRRLKLKID